LLLAGTQVYALGGYDASTPNYNSVTTAEVFDPATGQWKRIADMNVPKYVDRADS
jgi:hypothetical protein